MGEDKIRKFDSSDFDDAFIELLKKDLEKLEEIQLSWNQVTEDPKLDEFIRILKEDE